METKLNSDRMERVRKQCGFFNGIGVSANETRCGFGLAWNKNELVQLRSYPQNHINAKILMDDNGNVCFREEGWNLLQSLSRNQDLPWLVCGDFNEILYSFEKSSGCQETKDGWNVFRERLIIAD
ncbi:Exo_endo_phos domain-containing protein [Gossypium australe]|uniref:Exo_endo_phos domain-containing protein n=1 Tax=Gossypium australe TaxID=47621 RepID=A0A5B6V9G7_9ROSI|nr:Exo_endo_phos domain-containing protein [Gossypium australe]